MQLSFRSLTAPQWPTCLFLPYRPTLRFLVHDTKGGERVNILNLGGHVRWTRSFMCDTSCFHVYSHALCYMWYMCETYVTCVLSTLIYMSCHLIMLICFASAFHSDTNEFYFVYLCLFHTLWVHCVGLDHICMLNPPLFLLSIAYMSQAYWEPHSSFIHTRGCVVIDHWKGGHWKHLGS